ncbi:hypothetical protein AB0M54_30790 [Actinoplanes sp. NPDC051470]|uniref:hypothetical protein n=1 Tax=Actinoplanes sp. NPDC051470 TaxID=3157224 RepID=UPI003424714C
MTRVKGAATAASSQASGPDGGRVPAGEVQAEHGFDIFKNKQDNCEKVVLKP